MRLADLFARPTRTRGAGANELVGGVLAFLGFQIVVGMIVLTWSTLPMISAPLGGDRVQRLAPRSLARPPIYAVATLLGLIILLAGAVQATTGQRGKPAIAHLLYACASVAMLAGMGLSL